MTVEVVLYLIVVIHLEKILHQYKCFLQISISVWIDIEELSLW